MTINENGESIVSLRLATLEDVDQLVVWDEEAKTASTGTGFTPERRQQKIIEFQEKINNSNSIVRVIENIENNGLEKKAVGMIVAEINPRPIFVKFIGEPYLIDDEENLKKQPFGFAEIQQLLNNSKRANFLSIAISSEWRGQGLGKKATGLLLDILTRMKVEVLTFETGKENYALQKTIKDATYVDIEDANSGYGNDHLFGIKKL